MSDSLIHLQSAGADVVIKTLLSPKLSTGGRI